MIQIKELREREKAFAQAEPAHTKKKKDKFGR